MHTIGAHVSAAGGVDNAPRNARAIGATAFALFVKNQRQWVGKPLLQSDIDAFHLSLAESGISADAVLPHAGYLINLANPDDEAHTKSMTSFLDELHRCEALGLNMLNLHPGSHLRKLSPEAACDRVARSINEVLAQTHGVKVVIENTAGQGAYLGSTFEELARIGAGVDDQSRIGYCIDTAHTFAAGMDLRTAEGFHEIMDRFDEILGADKLCGMHLNDSKVAFSSHVDRHESLGQGAIGWTVFETIASDARFAKIPLIIETPNEALWPDEIARLFACSKER